MHALVILRFRATVRAAETDGVSTSLGSVADRERLGEILDSYLTVSFHDYSFILQKSQH